MKRYGWLVLLLAAMAAVQLVIARHHSLWADEVFSLAVATGHSVEHQASVARPELGDFVESPRPETAGNLRRYVELDDRASTLSGVLRAVKLSDTSPPLYYLGLNLWMRLFGTSDIAVRSLSVLLSLACVPFLLAIGRQLQNERAGVVAAVLFAMAPIAIYYSSEARMYSLLWLLVIVGAWLTLRLYSGEGRWGSGAAWITVSVAGLLTHYYFVFPFSAMIAFLVVRRGADGWTRLALRVGVVLLLVAPWYAQLPTLLSQWRITQDWVLWRPGNYSMVRVLWESTVRYFSGDGHYLWKPQRITETVALAIFACAAGRYLWRDRGRAFGGGTLLLWLWFLAAAIGPLVADVARKTYVAEYPRYGSAALPAACLLGGWWLSTLRPKLVVAAVLLIGLCWAPSVLMIGKGRGRAGQLMRDAAVQLNAQRRDGDLIIVHSIPSGGLGLVRYLDPSTDVALWVGQLRQRNVPESLERLIEGRRRVIVVKAHTVGEPAPEEDWLRLNANLIRDRWVSAVGISEFRPIDREKF